MPLGRGLAAQVILDVFKLRRCLQMLSPNARKQKNKYVKNVYVNKCTHVCIYVYVYRKYFLANFIYNLLDNNRKHKLEYNLMRLFL